MKPPSFAYHRPSSIEEAARSLAELGDEAKVIAGGQSLVPLLNFRLASPAHLVDINAIDRLDRIDVRDGAVEVGATVRQARLLLDEALVRAHPLLGEAARWIAHPVIRNRGTVCGSLAHADPAAELPALLALLDGSVEAVAWRRSAAPERPGHGAVTGGTHGLTTRRVAAAELFAGPLQTTLAPDELVVAASFPSLPVGTGWVVDELARRHGDFALAGVMLTVTVDGDGTPTGGRAAYMSCAPTPVVVDLGPAIAGAAAAPSPDRRGLYDLVASGLRPTDDIHASGEYRRHLAATLTVRALDRALARARAGTGTTDQPSEVPV